MKRTQVYLPEDIHRDLMLLAKTEKTNFSSLIREGARIVIKKKNKSIKKEFGKGFFGALKYGPKNLSTRINDIYK